MGGTQRLAERAGSGRARQFVMSGGIFDAAELERWGVVNEIYPEDEFEARSRALAEELAAGPTKAHAMTKHILKAFREGGVAAADEVVRTEAAELFATEDLQGAVGPSSSTAAPGTRPSRADRSGDGRRFRPDRQGHGAPRCPSSPTWGSK